MEEALREKASIKKASLSLGALLFFTHFIISVNNWYRTIPWVDIPQHIGAGVLAALVFYWMAYHFKDSLNLNRNPNFTILFVLGWTALLGVIWEFYELIYDETVMFFGLKLQSAQLGNFDTMKDLFDDLLGGLFLAIFMRLRYDRKKHQL